MMICTFKNEMATGGVAALTDGLATTKEIKEMVGKEVYAQKAAPAKHVRRGKTISEAEFRRLWDDPEISSSAIAKRLDITVSAVCCRARIRGFPPRQKYMLPEKEFRELWNAGVRTGDIVRHYGCSHMTPPNMARHLGLPRRGKGFSQRGIRMEDYQAQRLAKEMAAEAARRQACVIASGQADFITTDGNRSGARPVGADFARGALL